LESTALEQARLIRMARQAAGAPGPARGVYAETAASAEVVVSEDGEDVPFPFEGALAGPPTELGGAGGWPPPEPPLPAEARRVRIIRCSSAS